MFQFITTPVVWFINLYLVACVALNPVAAMQLVVAPFTVIGVLPKQETQLKQVNRWMFNLCKVNPQKCLDTMEAMGMVK
ncbi:MAG: hypothetical protein QE263_01880 [Vampirovibrionales bacterium]|nr:hypothetical protein [Vampirovibrionales bacterium]